MQRFPARQQSSAEVQEPPGSRQRLQKLVPGISGEVVVQKPLQHWVSAVHVARSGRHPGVVVEVEVVLVEVLVVEVVVLVVVVVVPQ